MASAIASKIAIKFLSDRAEQYEPPDPHYEYYTDERGKKQKKKRPVPPGLSKRDARILKKIRKRAHHLDKGLNLCGMRVGWTFFIAIIPGAGDVAAAVLNYTLVFRPCKALELPNDLKQKMAFNNALSFGVGLVPVAGDVFLAAWKANSRNAHLVEAYLTIRGQEHLATLNQGQSVIPPSGSGGVSAAALRRFFMGETETGTGTGQTYGAIESGAATPVAPTGTGAGANARTGTGSALGAGQGQTPGQVQGAGPVQGPAPMAGVQAAQGAERKKGMFNR